MAKTKIEHILLGIIAVVVIALLINNSSQQAILHHSPTQSQCSGDLIEDKEDYPMGFFPNTCVEVNNDIIDCLNTECYSSSLDGDLGDWVWYGERDGYEDMSSENICRFSCIHHRNDAESTKCGLEKTHDFVCNDNKAIASNVQGVCENQGIDTTIWQWESFACVESLSTPNVGGCSDSDGGNNPTVGGYIQKGSETKQYDYCVESSIGDDIEYLNEWYCDEGLKALSTVSCGDGTCISSNYGDYCSEECTPNWVCGAWGECHNSIQQRTCTDTKNCGTQTNKPITMQRCSDVEPIELRCSSQDVQYLRGDGQWILLITCPSDTKCRITSEGYDCATSSASCASNLEYILDEGSFSSLAINLVLNTIGVEVLHTSCCEELDREQVSIVGLNIPLYQCVQPQGLYKYVRFIKAVLPDSLKEHYGMIGLGGGIILLLLLITKLRGK